MRRALQVAIVAAAPLLTAALGMDEQPSYRAYEAPVLAPPKGSVPVTGREIVSPQAEVHNTVPPTERSLERGKALFAVNCAICHGATSAEPGSVGKKLSPPPPGLAPDMVQGLSDPFIFKAITFGFGRMPPFQEKLAPHERWDLVNFIRTRK